jgi:hypothetical protein
VTLLDLRNRHGKTRAEHDLAICWDDGKSGAAISYPVAFVMARWLQRNRWNEIPMRESHAGRPRGIAVTIRMSAKPLLETSAYRSRSWQGTHSDIVRNFGRR